MVRLTKSRPARGRVTPEDCPRDGGQGQQGQDEGPGGQGLSASALLAPGAGEFCHCRGRWVRVLCMVGRFSSFPGLYLPDAISTPIMCGNPKCFLTLPSVPGEAGGYNCPGLGSMAMARIGPGSDPGF